MTSHEDRFKQNVLGMAEFLYEIIDELTQNGRQIVDPNLVKCGADFLDAFTGEQLIQNFIKRSHMYWEKVKRKDESFFEDNVENIFGEIPMKHVTAFHELFKLRNEKDANGEPLISMEDQMCVWKYFQAMIKISIKYIHDMRQPYTKVGSNGEMLKKYKKGFFQNVDTIKEAAAWDVELKF